MSDEEVKGFAEMVLRVLDLQQVYFKFRNNDNLARCREAERELRKTAANVLALIDLEPLPAVQGSLFDATPLPKMPD
jgi:hypothetical protein